jgi:predicted permease
MTFRDLALRVRALLTRRRLDAELDEELAFHLEREAHRQMANGVSQQEARARARARFGSVALAAGECRDARGTALVEDLGRDIVYAGRTFRRAPLAAITIVATVGLGLGLVNVAFTVYNTLFLRADAVRNAGELFAVEWRTGSTAEETRPFTWPEYDAIRRETSVFTDAFAMVRPVRMRIEGRSLTAALVTGNFFDVLGVRPMLGRPLTPADDERGAARSVIVLSHGGWNKLFAGDPSVIGRRVLINRLPYEIVGVMPEDFRGLGIFAPDYWAPLALAGQFRDAYAGRENEIPIEVIGRLRPETSREAATAGLTIWAAAATATTRVAQRPPTITLRPSQGTLPASVLQSAVLFSPIFFVFGLILMIGCANVANLLFARGVSRQREIGIRLSLGASRQRIIRQLLTENVLLALAAAAGGLVVTRVFLQSAVSAVTAIVPPGLLEVDIAEYVPAVTDWRVLVFLVAGALVSTAFFGLVPTLQATRLELVQTLRGAVAPAARPSRTRHTLIAVQVGASALLLICAGVFLRGALAAATVDPGVRTTDTVVVSIASESRRSAVLQTLAAHPLVSRVAASSQPTQAAAATTVGAQTSADKSEIVSTSLQQMAVSPEYFAVLDVDIVRGRGFMPEERTADAGVIVASESAARRLWLNRDPLGQAVRIETTQADAAGAQSPSSRLFTVVGIARDLGGGLQFPDLFAFRGVYVPTSPEHEGTSLTLRIHGDLEQTRQTLLADLTKLEPAVGTINTLRSLAGMQTAILQIGFWVTVVLGGLALVLTVSGLFSVLSYIVEQRAKDIGVRIAVGATKRDVVRLVVSQLLRPVGIGLLAGTGLAIAVALALVATPAASLIGSIIRVLDPMAYAASLLVIVTSCVLAALVPALRAAHLDPLATLRKD